MPSSKFFLILFFTFLFVNSLGATILRENGDKVEIELKKLKQFYKDWNSKKLFEMIGQFIGYKAGNKSPKDVFDLMNEKKEYFRKRLAKISNEETKMVVKGLERKLEEFMEHSKVASLIGQSEREFNRLAFKLVNDNEQEGKILFGKIFNEGEWGELLREFREIVDDEQAKLERDIREMKETERGMDNLEGELPREFRKLLEFDAGKLMAKKLDPKLIEGMKERCVDLDKEIKGIKGKMDWEKEKHKFAGGRNKWEKVGEKKPKSGANPVLVNSSLDLKGLAESFEGIGGTLEEKEKLEGIAEGNGEKGNNEEYEDERQMEARLRKLMGELGAMKSLMRIRRTGNAAIENYMARICIQINKREMGQKEEEMAKREEKMVILNREEMEKKEREAYLDEWLRSQTFPCKDVDGKAAKKMLRIASEFRRFEFNFWLNRAASKLYDNLKPLAMEKELNREKLFEKNKNVERALEARELAEEIIKGLVEKMGLEKMFREWMDYLRRSGGEDEEEGKEEVKEEGKVKKKEEEEEDWELRKWKTKVRFDFARVMLAYEKMNKTLGFGEYVATVKEEEANYIPLLKRKNNFNLLKSAEQIPSKINEQIYALVKRVNAKRERKFEDFGRKTMT